MLQLRRLWKYSHKLNWMNWATKILNWLLNSRINLISLHCLLQILGQLREGYFLSDSCKLGTQELFSVEGAAFYISSVLHCCCSCYLRRRCMQHELCLFMPLPAIHAGCMYPLCYQNSNLFLCLPFYLFLLSLLQFILNFNLYRASAFSINITSLFLSDSLDNLFALEFLAVN